MTSISQAVPGVNPDRIRRTRLPRKPSPRHPLLPPPDLALPDEWPVWMLPDPNDLLGPVEAPNVEPDARLLARWAEFEELVDDGAVVLEPAETWLAAPVAARTTHEDLVAVLGSDAVPAIP
ncbi:MAG TPA: hypothetical protein VFX60_09245 [Micromonospora sp.]|nr:hypothetical protein [Micromonospora sp.]